MDLEVKKKYFSSSAMAFQSFFPFLSLKFLTDNGNDGDTNSSGSSNGLNMVIPQVENNNHVGNGLKRRKKSRFGVQVIVVPFSHDSG